MKDIRALLFDKDGTLFDFQATYGEWACALMWELADGDAAKADRLAARIRLDRASRRFYPDSVAIAGTAEDTAAALAPELPHLGFDQLLERMVAGSLDLAPAETVPLAPLMRRLRRNGLALGVATNDAQTAALTQLAALGLTGYFDVVIGADSGHGAKPDPGQCQAFCDAAGVAPAQVAMIGDSTHDLLAGAAAGMRTVAVLSGPARREQLAPFAEFVLPDIGYLPAWLGLD